MSANGLSERLQTPISTAELQRRWGLIRQAMEREKIDVLLMQNNNDHMGGAVKWFTDMPACNGYPMTVVFPRDDEMTVVMQGPFNGDSRPPADMWRGVKRMLTTPSYESAHYTNNYDPELAAKALAPYANATIGFVHVYQLSFALGDFTMKKFPARALRRRQRDGRPHQGDQERRGAGAGQARRADAGRRHEGGVRGGEARHARPRRGGDRAVLQPAQRLGERHLSLRLDAARQGGKVRPAPRAEPRHPEGRRRRAAGRGLGPRRHVHRARPHLRGRRQGAAGDEGRAGFVKESRKLTLDLLKPGTPCKDIWEQFNAFMRKNGRPEEARLYCHGQGYDLVERPLIRHDEPWTIEKDMNIVVHPTYAYGGYLNWLCDNYIIGGNGPGDRIHQFKEEVVEAG